MKSMPLKPRPGYGPYDGAFPRPAQDLAGIPETDWSTVDHQIGRRLLLIGGVVTAVGSLVGMTVKDRDGKSKARRLAKLGMLAGAAVGTWAMFDSAGREQLLADVRSFTVRPAEGLGALDDLDEQKREQIRQRALLSTIGLGPMAEPVHVQRAVQDLDPKLGTQLAAQHTERLRAEGAQALPTQRAGSVPVADTSATKNMWLIPAAVGVVVVGGSLLMKG